MSVSEWHFLGKHAITNFPGNKAREYVVVGKHVVGYAEQNPDNSWTYYQFGPEQKGVTVPPEPIEKGKGKTALEAAQIGIG